MSYAICRVAKCSSASSIVGSQIHDRRERGHSNSNPDIDFARSEFNQCLIDRAKEDGFNAFINKHLEKCYKGKRAVRKDAVRMVQLLFTSDQDFFAGKTLSQHLDFFNACVEWATLRFGASNIISAYIHYDEETPHLHLNFVPLSANGQHLSVRECGIGSGSVAFQQLQDDFFEEVGKKFDLQRGHRADLQGGERSRKHQKVAEYKEKTDHYSKKEKIAKKIAARSDGLVTYEHQIDELKKRTRKSKFNSDERVISEKDFRYLISCAKSSGVLKYQNKELTEKLDRTEQDETHYRRRTQELADDKFALENERDMYRQLVEAASNLVEYSDIQREAARIENEKRAKKHQKRHFSTDFDI